MQEVLEELKKDFPGKATLIIVSDHGFRRHSQLIQSNVILRKAGLLSSEGGRIISSQARSVTQGGSTGIYILDAGRQKELLPQALALLEKSEGVENAIRPEQFADCGYPLPSQDPHAPDFIVSARAGYMFSDSLDGDLAVTPKMEERGTHGYDPKNEALHTTFIAWGSGIKPGVKLPLMRNIDVAPTVAELLHLKMPGVEGEPLREILE